MLVGVPREIKTHEYRVGMTPASVRELTRRGHEVLVQTDAGHKIGLEDDDYTAAGAEIADSAAEIFERADMLVKGDSEDLRGRNGTDCETPSQ